MDLVEDVNTRKLYALKRIVCHSIEDQKQALQEIEYYKKLRHSNLMELVDSTFKGLPVRRRRFAIVLTTLFFAQARPISW